MNKIYKIVWSKAKHAYVVTSEVARSHTKSASGKAVKAALAAAVGMGVLMGGYAADAADTATGSGNRYFSPWIGCRERLYTVLLFWHHPRQRCCSL